ncbi:MAG: hypothetical protein ACXACX_21380 [Candidatus Hodarchaeales archaeon]
MSFENNQEEKEKFVPSYANPKRVREKRYQNKVAGLQKVDKLFLQLLLL